MEQEIDEAVSQKLLPLYQETIHKAVDGALATKSVAARITKAVKEMVDAVVEAQLAMRKV